MSNILEVVNTISQIVSNVHDGAIDRDGEPVKIGLKREKFVPFTMRRVMDRIWC